MLSDDQLVAFARSGASVSLDLPNEHAGHLWLALRATIRTQGVEKRRGELIEVMAALEAAMVSVGERNGEAQKGAGI